MKNVLSLAKVHEQDIAMRNYSVILFHVKGYNASMNILMMAVAIGPAGSAYI